MKLTEKQREKLESYFETFLFFCGIVFGLGILTMGLSMVFQVLSSLF